MKLPSVKVLVIGGVSLVFGLPGILLAAVLLCFALVRKTALKLPSVKALMTIGVGLVAGPPVVLVLALLLCFLEPRPYTEPV